VAWAKMAKIFSKTTLILLLIIGFSLFLRIYKISVIPVSLFGDEMDVGYHAYSILKTGKDYQGNFMPIHFHSLAEWRTPLYLYAAVPTVKLFGITSLGVRLPAVIFGVLGIWGMYLLVNEIIKNNKIALISSLILAISPWHLQYSRAGFEVTMLLTFLIFGLYFFFRSLANDGKNLWLSVLFITLMPWVYSTSKLFSPLLILFLFVVYRKDIVHFNVKSLFASIVTGLVIGIPISYSTIFGGGAERAAYTSVFTDPTVTSEIGTLRLRDLMMRGDLILGSSPSFSDRLFHNKISEWSRVIGRNYFQSFSSDFLFITGDPNLRHSPQGIGQFFKADAFILILGVILFFTNKLDLRLKVFILFWLIVGALPAELTRDGGNHATRLILILPPLVFLMSYGLVETYQRLNVKWRPVFLFLYSIILLTNIVFYFHNYYIHYPWDSERWWHYGFKESINEIKNVENNYDRVIISMSGEPAWIFFAGSYEYPPDKWQKEYPIGNDIYLEGFGKISHTGKFYFGSFNLPGKSIYDLPKYIDSKTLYLAVAKEVGQNLILNPESVPSGLRLIKAISYPSGEPAFYLFSKI
jgi:4-amino-4-deoxy-L-arabinose transferase-like glycosyltransferase